MATSGSEQPAVSPARGEVPVFRVIPVIVKKNAPFGEKIRRARSLIEMQDSGIAVLLPIRRYTTMQQERIRPQRKRRLLEKGNTAGHDTCGKARVGSSDSRGLRAVF